MNPPDDKVCGRIKLNVSGPICCGWSPIGDRLGLADVSAYPWHCWLAQREVFQEDMIIIENSAFFPVKLVKDSLGPTHEVKFLFCGPENLGWPTIRRRIYIIALKRSTFAWAGPMEDEITPHFLDIFSSSVQLDGDCFLLDDDANRREKYQQLARGRKMSISPSVATKDIKLQDLLSGGMRRHFMGYEKKFQQSTSLSSCFIADLHQSPEERPACGYMLPTQLTHGLHYSFSAGKLFTPRELLAAMGQPTFPQMPNGELWPYNWDALGPSQLTHASGNTMHGHVLSAVLMYAMAFSAHRSSGSKMPFLDEALLTKEQGNDVDEDLDADS